MAKASNDTMDKIIALCKGRGFIFQGSEIYGGLANAWDYGPLGVEFKNNVKRAWWKKFVQENRYNVGLDCAILMNRQVWVASGHVGNFNDPLMDCKACKARFRADKLIEDWGKEHGEEIEADGWSNEQLETFIEEKQIPCPTCGKHDFTGIRKFNMMFKTYQGVTDDASNEIYLRPETAQGIFVRMWQDRHDANCRLVSARLARASVMKSRRVTLRSVHVNLSRWSLSSSACRVRILNGSSTGAATAATGSLDLA